MATIRLCKKCHANAVKLKMMPILRGLINLGAWFCPFGKAECGKKIDNEQTNPESGQRVETHHSYRSRIVPGRHKNSR
jgi:hypothetical protein